MLGTIPIIQLRHTSVLMYEQMQSEKSPGKSLLRINNMQAQRGKQYSGQLSPGAKKRLAKACTLLVQSAKRSWLYNEVTKKMHLHQLSFITLTVSDPDKKLSGKEAHQKLLSHFLQWLRRTKNCNTYLWKAELQQNGQIHYHITTPAFIAWQEIRDKWNNLQKKAGLLDRYFEKKGHYNANSTDVHEVRNVKDAAGYLLKYITKETQNRVALGGKIWDCSDNLKINKYFSVEMKLEHEAFLNMEVENGNAVLIKGEKFNLWKFQHPVTERVLTREEFRNFTVFINNIRNGSKYIPPEKEREKYLAYEQKKPVKQQQQSFFVVS